MPDILVPEAGRLRLVVLVHMSLGEAPPSHAVADADTREAAVPVRRPVRRSPPVRGPVTGCCVRYALPPDKVHVAQPGVDPARLASGTDRGGELLCVAAVSSHKGHDVLLAALAATRGPAVAMRLRRAARPRPGVRRTLAARGRSSRHRRPDPLSRRCRSATTSPTRTPRRTCWCWPRAPRRTAWWSPRLWLADCRSSRRRSAGCRRPWAARAMAADPASWCRPSDSAALAAALRGWLVDADLRQRLREAARERRSTLPGWDAPTDRIARVLTQAAAMTRRVRVSRRAWSVMRRLVGAAIVAVDHLAAGNGPVPGRAPGGRRPVVGTGGAASDSSRPCARRGDGTSSPAAWALLSRCAALPRRTTGHSS